MSKFVLTAQLQLQAPTNTRQVANQMQQQLSNAVNIPINPVINTQALSNAQKQLTQVSVAAGNVSKGLRGASRSAESFGSALGAAARRFASITLATGFFLGITRAMGSAVGRAVEFEKEMLKISQVTGKSVRALQSLSGEVTKLSTTLGVSSEEILTAARTLSQAGLAADQVTKSLKILAQTDLAATFDNIADTTEGAVALINQFRKEVRAAGSEAKFLENALDAINAVSKNFAVESADLISVVRRTGGVFEAAGGQLNELIALFTSVRSTTRETADTIATGFRTIFTRIQRTETIDQLRELGIVLQDSTGKFVGPLEAIKRLSAGLSGLDPRDFRFNEIVEQLGGFRQIGKVIPLIKQYSTSVEALAVANNSMGSTAADAATAQQGLGNQFAKLKEKFDATVRDMVDSGTFRSLAEGALKFADAVLRIVDALEPLLPILAALAAFKLGQIAVPAFGRFAGIGGKNQGGKIHGFNSGGFVPGTGNRDTVPAMLTPGEFVIRKSSVNKIGASRLAEMNGYNRGTVGRGVQPRQGRYGDTTIGSTTLMDDQEVDGFKITGNASMLPALAYTQTKGGTGDISRVFGALPNGVLAKYKAEFAQLLRQPPYNENFNPAVDKIVMDVPFKNAPANESLAKSGDPKFIQRHMRQAVKGMATEVGSTLDFDIPPHLTFDESKAADKALASIDLDTISGLMFEAVTSMLSGAPLAEAGGGFDIPQPKGYIKKLEKLFAGSFNNVKAVELKRTFGFDQLSGDTGSLTTKLLNAFLPGRESNKNAASFGLTMARTSGTPDTGKFTDPSSTGSLFAQAGMAQTRNKGGQIDTVPAMLTPGEYVINKKSAQQIGYGNLNKMNKQGVANFNKGGPVQFFANGTSGTGVPGGGMGVGAGVNTSMEALASSATKLSYQLDTIAASISGVVDDFAALQGVDEKINTAATSLANGIAGAVDDVNLLQTVDDKLLNAVTPFANAALAVSRQLPTVLTKITASFDIAANAVTVAVQDFTKGMTTIDDTLRQEITVPAQAMEKAMQALTKHFNTFGTELMEKVKLFDALTTPIGEMAEQMNNFSVQLIGRLDDLNPMSSAAGLMATGLTESHALFTTGIQLMIKSLGGAVVQMRNALIAGAKGFTVVNPFAGLAAVTGPFATLMGQLDISVRAVGTQFNALAQNLAALNASIQNGNVSITNVATAAFDTDDFFNRLEASIISFITQMNQAGTAANAAGAGVATGGAATGAAVAAGAAAGGGGGGGMAFGNNVMMAGMMVGMLAQQMEGLSDTTKRVIMDVTMFGSILGMMAMQAVPKLTAAILSVGHSSTMAAAQNAKLIATQEAARLVKMEEIAANATGNNLIKAQNAVKLQNTVVTNANTTAKEAEAAASVASAMASKLAMVSMIGLTAVLTIAFVSYQNHIAASKEMTEEVLAVADSLREVGSASMNLVQTQSMVSAALQEEADATGSSMGQIIGAVLAVVGVALAAFTAGASLSLTALGAAMAAGATAGHYLGEAASNASEGILRGGALITAALYTASAALGELGMATKQMQLEQLEGIDLLKRQSIAFGDFVGASTDAIAAFKMFQDLEAGTSTDVRGEMQSSEVFTKIREAGVDAMKEMAEAFFNQAQELRKGISGAVDEMRESGATVKEIFANADIQRGFDDLATAVKRALTVQMLMTGQMRREAQARLGLAAVLEEDMTRAQRMGVIALEAALIDEEAAKTAEKARKAEEERIKAQIESDEKQKKAAAEKLASDIALAQSAHNAAMAMDLFSAQVLNFGTSMNMVMTEFGALTGSIKTYKTENEKLIASIATGTVTPEAEAALRNTASEFGVEAEANALLEDVKETERIRRILTEKGLDEFTNDLSEAATSLKFEEFLKDNNIDFSGLDADVRKQIKAFFEDGLEPEEIKKITEILNEQNKEQIKVLQDLAKMQNKYLDALGKFGSAIVKLRGDYIKSFGNLVKVQVKGAERLAKALGRDLTIAEVQAGQEAVRRAPLQAAGLAGGGVQATNIQLERNRARMEETNARIREAANRGATEEVIRLQNEQKELGQESKLLRENLKKLSDQSKLAAAVMGEIEKERGKRETVQGLIKEFTFASNKQRQEIDRNFVALQRVLATGTLASIPNEMRGAVGDLLDKLENIELLPGMTGGDISKNLQAQMANALAIRARGFGLNAQELKKIFESTTKEEKLINDLRAINAEEQAAAQALMQNQDQAMKDLIASIHQLIAELRVEKANAGAAAGGAIVGEPAQPKAKGGVIYASEGQPVFSPKGTDTVPAMLTPGEFVVNRKATSRNMGALSAINSGKVQYLDGGGMVGDSPYSWKNAPLKGDPDSIKTDYINSGGELDKKTRKSVKQFTKDVNAGAAGLNIKDLKILPDQTIPGMFGYLKTALHRYGGELFQEGWNDFSADPLVRFNSGIKRRNLVGTETRNQLGYLNKYILAGQAQSRSLSQNDPFANRFGGADVAGLEADMISGAVVSDLYKVVNEFGLAQPIQGLGASAAKDSFKTLLPSVKLIYDGNASFNRPSRNKLDGYLMRWAIEDGRREEMVAADSREEFATGGGAQGYLQYTTNPETRRQLYDKIFDMFSKVRPVATSVTKSHPKTALSKSGKLFYENAGGGSMLQLPVFSLMSGWYKGNEKSQEWLAELLRTSTEAPVDAEAFLQQRMAEGYQGEVSALQEIQDYKKKYKLGVKAFGFVGKSVRPLTDTGPGNKFAEQLRGWFAASPEDRLNKGLTKMLTESTTAMSNSVPKVSYPTESYKFKKGYDWSTGPKGNKDAAGSFLNLLGFVPWKTSSKLRDSFAPAGIPANIDGISNEVKMMLGFLEGHAVNNKDLAVAHTIDSISDMVEGVPGIGGIIKDAEKDKKKAAKEDAEAVAEAEAAEAAVAIKKFKVFYGNRAMKKEAMEEVLKKDPSVDGAPWPVWRIPPYAKENLDPEGVFDPRIPGPRPITYVADLKRNAQNFDALFTYFGDLSSDLRGMTSIGTVLTADNLGNINFDPNRLKGVMQETNQKGKITQKASLDILGKEPIRVMSAWSNKTADQWYKFDDEQMKLIHIFFGKNLEEGLTNTQKSAREAIIKASSLNPGQPWMKELGNPAWLQAGLKQAKLEENAEAIPAGFAPVKRAKGGPIGNVDWSPKGTDTVPAMLTPGEFVMQKSAVDRHGLGFMQRINAGKGSTGPYFQDGGTVEGDPTSERLSAGARNMMARGSMAAQVIINWKQGLVQNIGDWLNDYTQFFRPSDINRMPRGDDFGMSDALGRNDFRKWLLMRQNSIPRDEEFMESVEKTMNRFGIGQFADARDPKYDDMIDQIRDRYRETRYRFGEVAVRGMMRDAETLLGPNLMMQMPADLGFLISHVQKMLGDEKGSFLGKLGILGTDNVTLPEGSDASGYIGAQLRIGRPLPTAQFNEGMSKFMFQQLFPGAVDSIYPLYNPPAQDGHNKYPGKSGILGNDGKFHPLDTFSRPFEQGASYGLPKFAADVTKLFNHISNIALSRQTPDGTVIDKNLTDRGTYQTVYEDDTGVWFDRKIQGKVSDLANKPWQEYLVSSNLAGKNPGLLNLAKTLDAIEPLLPTAERSKYKAAKVISYQNAEEKGRQILKDAFLGFNAGGNVPGTGNTDTVPAMLTPGEFVMSKSAVEKYGVGFMRSINNGHKGAPGMKHKGGVQYLSDGDLASGSGGLDFSALSSSINTLSSSIATAFNGFTSAFNGFSALSELLSSTIAQMSNIAINHNITVNGQLSIPGFSQEAINSIVNTIADQVASQSTGKLKQMFQNFRDRQDRRT